MPIFTGLTWGDQIKNFSIAVSSGLVKTLILLVNLRSFSLSLDLFHISVHFTFRLKQFNVFGVGA